MSCENEQMPKRGIPLYVCISALVMAVVLLLTILMQLNIRYESKKVASRIVDSMFTMTRNSVMAKFGRSLHPMVTLADISSALNVGNGVDNFNKFQEDISAFFLHALDKNNELLALSYTFDNGTYFSIFSVQDENTRERFNAPKEAAYVVWSIADKSSFSDKREEIHVFLRADKSVITIEHKEANSNLKEREAYKEALSSNGLVISSPYIFKTTKQLGISCSMPLKFNSGVFSVYIFMNKLDNILSTAGLPEDTVLLLVNSKGELVAQSNNLPPSLTLQPLSQHNSPLIKMANERLLELRKDDQPISKLDSGNIFHDEGEQNVVMSSFLHEEYFIGKSVVEEVGGLEIVMISPAASLSYGIDNLEKKSIIFSLGILFLFIPFSILIARRIAKNLVNLVDESARIKAFDFSCTKSKTMGSSILEVQELGLAFETMKETIRLRTEELLNIKANLEKIVDERTGDLVQAKEVAEAASKLKSDFLHNISKEISTPINSIISINSMLLQTSLLPTQSEQLKQVSILAKSLLNAISDIVDFSKIESNKTEFEPTSFQLENILHNVAGVIGKELDRKKLVLLFEIAADVPIFLRGDGLRLGQVLLNLLTNAIKFTEHGEIILKIELVKQEKNQLCLRFKIKDSGIGIAPEHLGELLKESEPEKLSQIRLKGGTGLSLPVCQQVVKNLGGRLEVESKLGQGTEISFTAMFSIEQEMVEQMANFTNEILFPAKFTVLLVEANLKISEHLEKLLGELDAKVVTVQNLEFISEENFQADVVLVEYGHDLLPKLASLKFMSTSSVIIMTDYTQNIKAEDLVEYDVQGTLLKPVTRSSLLTILQRALSCPNASA